MSRIVQYILHELYFNCSNEAEGVLKVTDSNVRCKIGNISDTVQGRSVVTMNTKRSDYGLYAIAPFPE